MNKVTHYVSWILQITAAILMLQTLYYKFSGADESVYIFSTLGMEPVGRIGSGVAELIASVLLLIPSKRWLGAGLGMGIMAGAIISHLTILGIDVLNDGGRLFVYAVTVFLSCCGVLWIHREQPLARLASISKKIG